MSEPSIQISNRFCGPPQSGNGGYVAGRLAAYVEAPAVGVRLRVPPVLEAELVVRVSEERASLYDGAALIAEARPVEFTIEPPAAPSFDEAVEAAKRFRGFDEHVFPGCFVCGPERATEDGLRIFPGLTDQAGLFAAPWVPHASLLPDLPPDLPPTASFASHDPLASGDGGVVGSDTIPIEFLWAALDCPGAFAFPQPEGKVILLGEMQAAISGSVSADEPCVLASWEIEAKGRKHLSGSALYGEAGDCRGVALGVWFEVDADAVPSS
jgi:hypothetical protein